MTITELKAMLADGSFDHATYRNHGTLWEGLWIYAKAEQGFRGYVPAGAFFRDSAELREAEQLTRGTGISVGAFGQG